MTRSSNHCTQMAPTTQARSREAALLSSSSDLHLRPHMPTTPVITSPSKMELSSMRRVMHLLKSHRRLLSTSRQLHSHAKKNWLVGSNANAAMLDPVAEPFFTRVERAPRSTWKLRLSLGTAEQLKLISDGVTRSPAHQFQGQVRQSEPAKRTPPRLRLFAPAMELRIGSQ